MNLYGFAGGDPVNYSDPFGLCPDGVNATGARGEANRTTVISCEDGTEEVRQGGTRAWRNNNPGNLRASGLAAGKADGFAVFNNATIGNEAMWRQVSKDAQRGLTLGEFISKYAPAFENDTERYLSVVMGGSGLTAGTKLSSLTEVTTSAVIRAMQRHEGAVTGTVTYRPRSP